MRDGVQGKSWERGVTPSAIGPRCEHAFIAAGEDARAPTGGRQSFTGLLTEPQFRMVIRELENRRGGDFIHPHVLGAFGDAFSYPPGPIVDPQRSVSRGIEAAEILNSLRMDRYRQDCERLKHSEMHGTPALYPTQIPRLGSP